MKNIYYKELTPRSAKGRIDILVKEYEKSLDTWHACKKVADRLGAEDSIALKCAWERLDGLSNALRVLGITNLKCLAD